MKYQQIFKLSCRYIIETKVKHVVKKLQKIPFVFYGCYSGSCLYSVYYAEGSSINGNWHTDYVSFPPLSNSGIEIYKKGAFHEESSFVMPFGCHTVETHLFLTQLASGIMGLHNAPNFGPPAFTSAAWASQKFTHNMLSLCFSESGGSLSFGSPQHDFHEGANSSSQSEKQNSYLLKTKISTHTSENIVHDALPEHEITDSNSHQALFPIVWLMLAPNGHAYTLYILRLQVGAHIIPIQQQNRFSRIPIDSGTTYNYFTPKVYSSILKAIKAYLSSQSSPRGLKEEASNTPPFAEEHTAQYDHHSKTPGGIIGLHSIAEQVEDTSSKISHEKHSGLRNLASSLNDYDIDKNIYYGDDGNIYNVPASATPRKTSTDLSGYPQCWLLSHGDEDLRFFPDMTFFFIGSNTESDSGSEVGSRVVLKPRSYLFKKQKTDYHCLAMDRGEENLLGIPFFLWHDVIFDLGASRLGVVPAECPITDFQKRISL